MTEMDTVDSCVIYFSVKCFYFNEITEGINMIYMKFNIVKEKYMTMLDYSN